jgi:hypothetical protein
VRMTCSVLRNRSINNCPLCRIREKSAEVRRVATQYKPTTPVLNVCTSGGLLPTMNSIGQLRILCCSLLYVGYGTSYLSYDVKRKTRDSEYHRTYSKQLRNYHYTVIELTSDQNQSRLKCLMIIFVVLEMTACSLRGITTLSLVLFSISGVSTFSISKNCFLSYLLRTSYEYLQHLP